MGVQLGMAETTTQRAIGIKRVSQRDDDSGHSPEVQERAILREAAATTAFTLDPKDIWDENVDDDGKTRRVHKASAGGVLADRPKLLAAIEAIERGEAHVIVAERLDRLFRDLDEQRAIIKRVEAAGGRFVVASGQVSHATAEAELQANMSGSFAQYGRRTAIERSHDAVQIVIESGVPPWPNLTPGFLLNEDHSYRKDPKLAPVVLRAFELRAAGKTIKAVRDMMRESGFPGIEHRTVERLLADRSGALRGKIIFGKFEPNEAAHDRIVSDELWQAVQATKVPRGRLAKSDRLLARAGVLRCGTCDRAMVIGKSNYKYFAYKCGWMECPKRTHVAAPMIEEIAAKAAVARAMHTTGHASTEQDVRMAEIEVEQAWEALTKRVALLDGFEDVPGTREQLQALRQEHTDAQERLAALRGTETTVHIDIASDWDRLTLAEQRELVKSTIRRIVIASGGKGLERVSIEGHHDEQFVVTEEEDGFVVSVLAPAPASVEAAAQRVADRAARRLT